MADRNIQSRFSYRHPGLCELVGVVAVITGVLLWAVTLPLALTDEYQTALYLFVKGTALFEGGKWILRVVQDNDAWDRQQRRQAVNPRG